MFLDHFTSSSMPGNCLFWELPTLATFWNCQCGKFRNCQNSKGTTPKGGNSLNWQNWQLPELPKLAVVGLYFDGTSSSWSILVARTWSQKYTMLLRWFIFVIRGISSKSVVTQGRLFRNPIREGLTSERLVRNGEGQNLMCSHWLVQQLRHPSTSSVR